MFTAVGRLGAVHPVAERNAREYLAIADRIFGDGGIVGFYVVGSAACGEFRPNRSDLDFIAVLDEHREGDCRRIRRVQLRSIARTGTRAVLHARLQGAGTCNGVYVTAADLTRPVTEIEPIGSHTGIQRSCGAAFDVNPVVWKTFAERGIPLRGPQPADLNLDPQPKLLRRWNLDNLNTYWRSVATANATGSPGPHSRPYSPRWVTAWGVLGPTRLHHTVATGGIVSKGQAGEYALDVFDTEWHPIVNEALAYWRRQPADPMFKDRRHRYQTTGRFGLHVIEAANAL